ncbi:cell division protein SepF [Labedaea rhizosphaerae]|uniref:Cell division protein SepF n=1 Tax=Labedaea rhizosphaerae TaxID=598644 RepID=A0A4R6SC77_LABRH|nr:cell division protein SepF [Labedaea rhizosphaerae]TDP97214.1 cell division inhibitor SepF [Labedaea rhizosphaerae]
MSALQKLKAYFGMVPADELDDYDGEYDEDGYRRYHDSYRAEYDDDYAYQGGRRRIFGRRYDDVDEEEFPQAERPRSARPAWATPVSGDAPTHGALAVEPRRETAPKPRVVTEAAPSPSGFPHGRIVTLHPTSYSEARVIGEHYRDGSPVIMNLTEMDDQDAKRLVDFAAGLVFALRGSFDKVTTKVFLISPPNADPTAEDRRRIAEGGYHGRG